MKKTGIFALCAALFLASALLSGCQKKAGGWNGWLTDFEKAEKEAAKKGKNIFLLFSGEDWDGKTSEFRAAVLEDKAFSPIAKHYVLLHIDFSETEYAEADIGEDATAAQQKRAQEIAAEYDKREDLADTYNLTQYPSIYILSPEGYLLARIPYDKENLGTPAALAEGLASQADIVRERENLIAAVRNSSGLDRVRAIDALFEAMEPECRACLAGLAAEVPQIDSQDETGLLGKYELWNAYIKMQKALRKGEDRDSSVQLLIDAAESGHLDGELKQEAFYTAAYLLAALGSQDFDRLFVLLQLAQDASPESSAHLQYIDRMREALRQMQAAAAAPAVSLEEPASPDPQESGQVYGRE